MNRRAVPTPTGAARSPLWGMMHALILLLFMMLAVPWHVHSAIGAGGGVLVVVSWNMAEKKEFALLLRDGAALVLP